MLKSAITYLLVTLVLAVSLLLVVRFYFEPPLWGKNFGLSDVRYFFGPNAFLLDTSLADGEYPLWNPLNLCGAPFAADPQVSAAYPPNLLRSLLTPGWNQYATAVSLHLMVALHVLLGGIGMFRLCREYFLSIGAGITAACIFMFNPFSIVYCTEFPVFPLVVSWTPWLIWLSRRALTATDTRRFLRYSLLTALLFGLSTLAGFPQLSVYIGLTILFFCVLHSMTHFDWSTRQRFFRRCLVSVQPMGLLLLMIACGGGLLAAILILPAAEFAGYSARAASSALNAPKPEELDFMRMIKCFVVFPGDRWLPIGCRAAGIGSLLSMIAALGHPRKRDALVFFVLFWILVDCTFGPPFPVATLLQAVDFLNIMISPWRMGIIASFALAMCSAFGIDAAASHVARRGWLAARIAVIAGAAAGMLAMLGYWMSVTPLMKTSFLVWLLPALSAAACCVFACVQRPRLGRVLIASLISAEVLVWACCMLPQYVGARLGGRSTDGFDAVDMLWQGNHRHVYDFPNWHMWTLGPAINGYDPLYLRSTRRVLCAPRKEKVYSIALNFREAVVDNQFGNLFAKRSFWLSRQWVAGALPSKDALYPSAATVFLPNVKSGTNLPIPEALRNSVLNKAVSAETRRIELGEGAALGSVKGYGREALALRLPSIAQDRRHSVLYVACKASGPVEMLPVCRDEAGRLYHLKAQRLKPDAEEQEIIIPLPDCVTNSVFLKWPVERKKDIQIIRAHVLQDMQDEDSQLEILRRRTNSVELKVKGLSGPRALLFVDSYYPGWRAWINGKETPILKANDAFKAIMVPPGDHLIRFEFRPDSFVAGLVTSLVTLAILLLAVLASFLPPFRPRARAARHESPAEDVTVEREPYPAAGGPPAEE